MIYVQRNKLLISLLLSITLLPACSQEPAGAPSAPRGYPNETLLKAAWALGMLKLIDTHPSVPDDLAAYRGIVYSDADTAHLKLDIYEKKNLDTTAPVILFIHGGGWSIRPPSSARAPSTTWCPSVSPTRSTSGSTGPACPTNTTG